MAPGRKKRIAEAKTAAIAGGYGFLAGAVAAMNWLSHLVWSGPDARWYIFLAILAGGGLIAALRQISGGHEASLAQQLYDAGEPAGVRHRLILCLAGIAIIAVAFGGAIGPEAGILAVVSEMSVLVSMAVGESRERRQLIGEAGAAGALGGIYGSPPGGAAMTADKDNVPRALLFLAALTGLLGFLVVARLLLEGGGMRIKLGDYVAPGDGSDIVRALPAALLGGVAGVAFAWLLPKLSAGLQRLGSVTAQTLVGTLVFACLAAAFPILRFSGHHEMEAMLEWGQSAGIPALMALALLKVLALGICLAAGWRGGGAFPLLFAGAAAGASALALLPDTNVTLALIAGMSAAITAGLGKPVVAALITLFLVSPLAVGPLCVGVAVGYGFSRLVPASEIH